MGKYTAFVNGEKITIQEADYIEDGFYVEIIGSKITLFEIPSGGGQAIEIGTFTTVISAINHSKILT